MTCLGHLSQTVLGHILKIAADTVVSPMRISMKNIGQKKRQTSKKDRLKL